MAPRVTKKAPPVKKATEPLRLELACGQRKEDGWTVVDIAATTATDVIHDLETFPWPFKDNSVDEARCSHFVEHLSDMIGFMNELHRVMKPGAKCLVVCPYYSSVRAWQDPTHLRAISEHSFLYFNQEWMKQNGLDHYGITADFDFEYGYAWSPEWTTRPDDARAFALKHYVNVVDDIYVTLTKRDPA